MSVAMSLFKSVVGSGVLAVPYCFTRAGVPVTLALMVIVWMATVRTIHQVCTCAMKIDGSMMALRPVSPILKPSKIRVGAPKERSGSDETVTFLHLVRSEDRRMPLLPGGPSRNLMTVDVGR